MSWVRSFSGWFAPSVNGAAATQPPPKTRVLCFGLLCWAVCNLLPAVHRAAKLPLSALVLSGLAPVVLTFGLSVAANHARAATYALLTGFPIALALGMSRFEHELALATYSPASLLFALLSLAGYAASVSQMAAAHDPTRAVDHKPLGEVAPVDSESRKQKVGALVLGLMTLAASVTVCFSSFQVPSEYREHWGRAAAHGAVLTALVAGLVGAGAIAMVAPGLRAERKRSKRRESRDRRTVRLLVTALSFAALYVLSRR